MFRGTCFLHLQGTVKGIMELAVIYSQVEKKVVTHTPGRR
jgi:hypothetical protein